MEERWESYSERSGRKFRIVYISVIPKKRNLESPELFSSLFYCDIYEIGGEARGHGSGSTIYMAEKEAWDDLTLNFILAR